MIWCRDIRHVIIHHTPITPTYAFDIISIHTTMTMDVDAPTGTPLEFLEKHEAAAPPALRPAWTKIRTAYEKK